MRRTLQVSLLSLGLLVGCLRQTPPSTSYSTSPLGTLTVHVFDVGQGDAILLQSHDGDAVLIDAGDGRTDLPGVLRSLGVKTLDLVFATHAHADHIGGMDEVLESFQVGKYFDQGMPHSTNAYKEVVEALKRRSVARSPAQAGQTFELDGGVRIEVLFPTKELLSGTRSDHNANSVVVRVTHGENCFLFAGDSEDPTERSLLRKDLAQCDVLKVAHHGSSHSTSREWLRVIDPEVALISAGRSNRYGHPSPETLIRLEDSGAEIYRTDLLGSIRLISDGHDVEIKGARRAQGPVATSRPLPSQAEAQVDHAPSPSNVVVPKTSSESSRVGQLIDLNSASAEELDALPGIGPVKSKAIVSYREQKGPFRSIDELLQVSGIGPVILTSIRPLVTVR